MDANEYAGVRYNGQKFLQNRRTLLLALSPGNPHYFKEETLRKIFRFAEDNSDKILIFIPGKIAEHNFKALHVSPNDVERKPRRQAKRLRNKCNKVLQSWNGFSLDKYSYVNWIEEVETCPEYSKALGYVSSLYQKNEKFRYEIKESTEAALLCMRNGRGERASDTPEQTVDVEEGVNYILKELAFMDALPNIHANCQEFVLVYHRPWPVLEKYSEGFYDSHVRPFVGFLEFQ